MSLIIEDDGRGFEASNGPLDGKGGGVGLVGMRERAALIGAEVHIESTLGRGTTVFMRVPLTDATPALR